jgi:hypothetical protein
VLAVIEAEAQIITFKVNETDYVCPLISVPMIWIVYDPTLIANTVFHENVFEDRVMNDGFEPLGDEVML